MIVAWPFRTLAYVLTRLTVCGAGLLSAAQPVTIDGVTGIAACNLYTVALQADGTAWAWGWNAFGQLGDGTRDQSVDCVRIKGSNGEPLTDIVSLAAGESHMAAVKRDGTVWAWGANGFGQLGDGTRIDSAIPVQVNGPDDQGALTGITAVALGEYHTVALKMDGTVWEWGRSVRSRSPVNVKAPGGGGALTGIVAIAAGRGHNVALKDDGTVWAWGANRQGQLGDGTTSDSAAPVPVKGPDGEPLLSDVVAISAASGRSSPFSIALRQDGTVWAWGSNRYGQLGDGTRTDATRPVQVKGAVGVGFLSGVAAIAAGESHAVAVKADGAVWAWGRNQSGQLGDGSTVDRLLPVRAPVGPARMLKVAAGSRHTVGLCEDGTLLGWGSNWYGQLGEAVSVPDVDPAFPHNDVSTGGVLWTTAAALMPQWGFYPNGQAYGGVTPLGGGAAWTLGTYPLTWVADIPEPGRYAVWIRKVYGAVDVRVNGEALTGPGRPGPQGRFGWERKGTVALQQGRHHVDLEVRGQCMVDAILLAASGDFDPEKDVLPAPVEQPASRAPRRYRDDSALADLAGDRGFVAGQLPLHAVYEEIFDDWMPEPEDVSNGKVMLWGSANQYINGAFAIRARKPIEKVEVSLAEMTGPDGSRIGRNEIDLRVVFVRDRMLGLFSWPGKKSATAELLLRDNRTALPPTGHQGGFGGGACVVAIPAGESRQFWMTVHVPEGSPSGRYTGSIVLSVGTEVSHLPVEIELLPLNLKKVDGYYSIYYPLQPVHVDRPNYVPESRYLAELEDMVRHGLNTVTLYGGTSTLHLARQAGMHKAPCIMGWPDSKAPRAIEAARRMGFEDLLFYGIDEPTTEAQVQRLLKECERRAKMGVKTLTAITTAKSVWEQLKDAIEYPVLIITSYDGRNADAPMYAKAKGFTPVSYWMTNPAFPLWHRALAGLYNTACGYEGTSPWSYTDFVHPLQKYDPDQDSYQLTYPDEHGEPIPTLKWEAYRAGIDDVRYLQALVRALATGKKRLAEPAPPEGLREAITEAEKVHADHFESIGGRWFQYLIRTRMLDLDAARRAFAEATVKIEAHLR